MTIEERLLAIEPRLKITPTSLEFPDDLTFEKWIAIGKVLAEKKQRSRTHDVPRTQKHRPTTVA